MVDLPRWDSDRRKRSCKSVEKFEKTATKGGFSPRRQQGSSLLLFSSAVSRLLHSTSSQLRVPPSPLPWGGHSTTNGSWPVTITKLSKGRFLILYLFLACKNQCRRLLLHLQLFPGTTGCGSWLDQEVRTHVVARSGGRIVPNSGAKYCSYLTPGKDLGSNSQKRSAQKMKFFCCYFVRFPSFTTTFVLEAMEPLKSLTIIKLFTFQTIQNILT